METNTTKTENKNRLCGENQSYQYMLQAGDRVIHQQPRNKTMLAVHLTVKQTERNLDLVESVMCKMDTVVDLSN